MLIKEKITIKLTNEEYERFIFLQKLAIGFLSEPFDAYAEQSPERRFLIQDLEEMLKVLESHVHDKNRT